METKGAVIYKKLLFLYFVIFPFGQIARVGQFLLIDLVTLLFIPGLYVFRTKPKVKTQVFVFLIICVYSLLFSLSNIPAPEVVKGALYLVRLLANFSLFFVVFKLVRGSSGFSMFLIKCLVIESIFISIFGWFQYFIYPDIRAFTIWGWDDHLNRLVGTFLDPGMTSILLVLGALTSLYLSEKFQNRFYLLVSAFLFLTMLFTYARSGYLALTVGSFILFRKKLQMFLVILTILLVGLTILPRPQGEGVRLERTASINARIRNYSETLKIIKTSPLLGIGYNNLCFVRSRYFGVDKNSHSCSGSDSSLLFVWATTGFLGLITFLILSWKFFIKSQNHQSLMWASGGAIVTHSLFVGSLFYPWVMGWILILAAISIKE